MHLELKHSSDIRISRVYSFFYAHNPLGSSSPKLDGAGWMNKQTIKIHPSTFKHPTNQINYYEYDTNCIVPSPFITFII